MIENDNDFVDYIRRKFLQMDDLQKKIFITLLKSNFSKISETQIENFLVNPPYYKKTFSPASSEIDITLPIDIEIMSYTPRISGKYSGLPENCYPEEPAEIDFIVNIVIPEKVGGCISYRRERIPDWLYFMFEKELSKIAEEIVEEND